MSHTRAASAAAATLLAACSLHSPPPVDLSEARAAVEAARAADAPSRAPAQFAEAERDLAHAEGLFDRRDRVLRAEMLARVTVLEARLAVALSRGPEWTAEMRRNSHDEQTRRLEDRIALLTRELQLAEAQIAQARDKAMDTKAEAASAIAEAEILSERAAADRARAAVVHRCRELIADAEKDIARQSFGSARWLALKCEALLRDTERGAKGSSGEHGDAPTTSPVGLP